MLEDFLDFVARDLQRHPEALKGLSREFAARLASLTKGKRVDIEAAIEGDVDL
jgi:antitoxin PrlF